MNNKVLFLTLILVAFSFLANAINPKITGYAVSETCSVEEIKSSLRNVLYDYFKNPSASKLSLGKIKDLLYFYLSTTETDTVDCSQQGIRSAATYKEIIEEIKSTPLTTPKCNDETIYGTCSSTKPLYCYSGSLISKCGICGCPSGFACLGDVCIASSKNDTNISQPPVSPPTTNNTNISQPPVPPPTNETNKSKSPYSSYECSDGIDNDIDHKIDYPLDPECFSSLDPAEDNLNRHCSDGIDNDNDGKIDYLQDPGCLSRVYETEVDSTTNDCNNGIDDDHDTLIDDADPSCQGTLRDDGSRFGERSINGPACDNVNDNYGNFDDDCDGKVNYIFDFGNYVGDPGCTSAFDTSELGTASCDDGIDNDNDGTKDATWWDPSSYVQPPACQLARYNSKDSDCVNLADNTEIAVSSSCSDPDIDGKTHYQSYFSKGSCTYNGVSYTDYCQSSTMKEYYCQRLWHGSYWTEGCALWDPSYTCPNGCQNGACIPGNQCSDGIDNDNDGKIDMQDSDGCTDTSDNDETDKIKVCTDTDNGVNLFVKGSITATGLGTGGMTSDWCSILNLNWEGRGWGYGLNEFSCTADNTASLQDYECPSGYACDDGACKIMTNQCTVGTKCIVTGGPSVGWVGYQDKDCIWNNIQRCDYGCSNGVCN